MQKRSVRAKEKNLDFFVPKTNTPKESFLSRGSRTPGSEKTLLSRGSKIKLLCKWCNKDFYGAKGRRFCSLPCFWKWSEKDPQGNLYKGAHKKFIPAPTPRQQEKCYICKKPIKVRIRDKKRRKYFTCSIKCVYKLRKIFTGSKCSAWKGGISFEPYARGWNDNIKEQVRRRDGHRCQICGLSETEYKRKLSVHHIDYNKKNLKLPNLVTLCNTCHLKTNQSRKQWTRYFSQRQNCLCLPVIAGTDEPQQGETKERAKWKEQRKCWKL